jgi:hypothetical protein
MPRLLKRESLGIKMWYQLEKTQASKKPEGKRVHSSYRSGEGKKIENTGRYKSLEHHTVPE